MKHFKKHYQLNYRFLVNGWNEWRLYPYRPRNNEFEKSIKYRLCTAYYCPEHGEMFITTRYLVSSIKDAENIINGGVHYE